MNSNISGTLKSESVTPWPVGPDPLTLVYFEANLTLPSLPTITTALKEVPLSSLKRPYSNLTGYPENGPRERLYAANAGLGSQLIPRTWVFLLVNFDLYSRNSEI